MFVWSVRRECERSVNATRQKNLENTSCSDSLGVPVFVQWGSPGSIDSMRLNSMNIRKLWRQWQSLFASCCAAVTVLVAVSSAHGQTSPPPVNCDRTVKAEVVALDQVLIYNRLGAINPAGMMYALKDDVVAIDPAKGLVPGNVQLRPGKRPRPIALRMNVGDCLVISFTNLLAPDAAD